MTGTYGSLRGSIREDGSISSGVLYLIFALFSGLVGTAFSVLVRPCADIKLEYKILLHFIYMQIPTRLGKGESLILNIASLYKGMETVKSITVKFRGIALMVKATLLELYLVVAS